MRFSFEVGDADKSQIDFYRDPLLGTTVITANGQLVAFKDPAELSTHYNLDFLKRYEFTVGEKKPHEVVVEHQRPLLLGGLRRNEYRVFVDAKLTQEHYGY